MDAVVFRPASAATNVKLPSACNDTMEAHTPPPVEPSTNVSETVPVYALLTALEASRARIATVKLTPLSLVYRLVCGEAPTSTASNDATAGVTVKVAAFAARLPGGALGTVTAMLEVGLP